MRFHYWILTKKEERSNGAGNGSGRFIRFNFCFGILFRFDDRMVGLLGNPFY